MIQVNYRCRTGNRLFQYCFGRILAERLGYELRAAPIDGFPSTANPIHGASYQQPLFRVHEVFDTPSGPRAIPDRPEDGNRIISRVSFDNVADAAGGKRVLVDGFFEFYPYFHAYRDQIRNDWIIPDPSVGVEDRHPDDLVIHIRRNDMVTLGWSLPWSYYERLLAVADYRRLFIVTDQPDDPFFERMTQMGAEILSTPAAGPDDLPGTIRDFKTIMSFNNIAITSGTFGWWAAFLSHARRIYFPVANEFGITGGTLSRRDLWVPEGRYAYVGLKHVYRANPRQSSAR